MRGDIGEILQILVAALDLSHILLKGVKHARELADLILPVGGERGRRHGLARIVRISASTMALIGNDDPALYGPKTVETEESANKQHGIDAM